MRVRPNKLTRAAVEKEAELARRRGTVLNLSGDDFTGGDYSNVDFTSHGGHRDGFNSRILAADFRNVPLVNANFSRVDLACANLRGTNLTGANLVGSNLYNALLEGARLNKADLRSTNLVSAELNDTEFEETDFAGARFGWTSLVGIDLSKALGLDEVLHIHPSPIDITTLQQTVKGLSSATDSRRSQVLRFLRNIGLTEDLLSIVRSWIGKPIEFYSVFLSHSSLDKEFCRKLYGDLQSLGVRCWYDEHEILPGDPILEAVDRGIKLWDKMIFVCSRNSLSARTGWWVEQELERAFAKERDIRAKTGRRESIVIPLTIDDHVFQEREGPHKATLLERKVADFRDWRDAQSYAAALENLVRALGERR